MSLREMLQRLVVEIFVERAGREKTLDDLAASLRHSSHEISLHLGSLVGSSENCRQLGHVIAIERWGQARIRVALGGPFLPDEADVYAPPVEGAWPQLINDFITTRQASLDLIREIQDARLSPDFKIHHNQFGPLSLKGWLRYLDEHALVESKRLHTTE